MNKYLILLSVVLFSAESTFSQFYIRLEDKMGLIDLDSVDILNDLSENLKNTLPSEYADDFKVYSQSVYLHTVNFEAGVENAWSIYIDSVEHFSEYYFAFLIISSPSNLYSTIDVRYKLPPILSFSQCYDEQYANSLVNVISNKLRQISLNGNNNYEFIEIELIKFLTLKLQHVTYCCDLPGIRTNETCNECFFEYDDVLATLENNGYFNMNKVLEQILNCKVLATISPKNYTTINSEIQIEFYNTAEGVNYNLTDGIENYMLNYINNIDYSLEVYLFDNLFDTEEIQCFEEIPESRASSNFDLKESIIVLNYNSEYNIFIKLDPGSTIELIDKLPVYLYNATFEATHSVGIDDSKLLPIMNTSFNDAKNIYLKNGFDIFQLQIIQSKEEYDQFQLDRRKILYCFRNSKASLSTIFTPGLTSFENGLTLKLVKNPGYPGCYIDMSHIDYPIEPYGAGFTLAHELLHCLITRGAYVIGLPMLRLIENEIISKGQHWDPLKWPVNLNSDRAYVVNFPVPKEIGLNDPERILTAQKYFVLKYIFSNVE